MKQHSIRLVSILVTLTCLILGTPATFGSNDEAAFTYSNDPNKVVLLVAVMTQYVNRSFMLHGDGRLVVAQFGSDRRNLREHTFELTPDECRELLQIAVDHRLPEYDATSIRARELRAQLEGEEVGFFHQGTTLVNLALETYTRNGITVEDFYTQIRVRDAKVSANLFPEITEYQGIKLLEDHLYAFLQKAGWKLW